MTTTSQQSSASKNPTLFRDQQRARHAYRCVASVKPHEQRDYEIAVNDLGANILRGGLCAALAALQRLGPRGEVVLAHLAAAGVPGLERADKTTLVDEVRKLDTDGYILATREMLRVAAWLKRAAQATFGTTEA
ncbi:MAG: type III-B CRISPR module-associated protein Cmr5 [Chloroflexota bacterium]|nr:type III-B CRISPR module-associated protein Cmr5 [Dehalococcoidia bacterium]MDW8253849.1 type III-B CRISPR module-associated protein Cmr5 [Chloroflexota bacterium]